MKKARSEKNTSVGISCRDLVKLSYGSMGRKHRKWPLGTLVGAKTLQGYKIATIFKHDPKWPYSCMVQFDSLTKIEGSKYLNDWGCTIQILPFRNLKKLKDNDIRVIDYCLTSRRH